MNRRIIICGGNGAGKTTLGRELSKKTKIPFMDVEDYYFSYENKGYRYDTERSKEEVEKMLISDMYKYEEFIFAATKPNFSEDVVARMTMAIYLKVPKQIRIRRVINRSYSMFGNRILPGGDLHEKENKFFNMVRKRNEMETLLLLNELQIPLIEVDGEKDVDENVGLLLNLL